MTIIFQTFFVIDERKNLICKNRKKRDETKVLLSDILKKKRKIVIFSEIDISTNANCKYSFHDRDMS